MVKNRAFRAALVAGTCGLIVLTACNNGRSEASKKADSSGAATARSSKATDTTVTPEPGAPSGPLDTALYRKLIVHLANGDSSGRWPVKTVYPNPGAILPFKRIVAYYGNLYSKRMGVLGEYPPDEMLRMLKGEVKKWQAADTTIPVIPALHYIAVTAQGSAGRDGKYRARMPFIWRQGSMPSFFSMCKWAFRMYKRKYHSWKNISSCQMSIWGSMQNSP
jgi:hypothetical protein